MTNENEAREFLLREIPDLLDAELDTEMREMVQRLMAAFAAEQNRDLIAERDGLRERVEIAREAFHKVIYGLDCMKKGSILFERLTAENSALRERLDEILRYTKGHEEPGHECVLCLIEATAKGELKPARQYLDGQKEKGK